MSDILPNLIHPVDVTIEQINRLVTIYDDDAREPVQAAARRSAVVVPGQPRWGSSRQLEATAGGSVDNAAGYVLFRSIDLAAAEVYLQINDRLSFQGRELYIVRLQPAGHYGGVSKLTRAYFADREPAKSPAPAPRPLRPNEVGGLKVWLESCSGIECFDLVTDKVRRWINQSDFGISGDFQSTGSATRAPTLVAGTPPAVRFDAANQEYLFGLNLQDMFGADPLSIFIVASLSGTGPSPLLGQWTNFSGPYLRISGESAVYRGPGGELSFPRNTDRAVRSFHVNNAGDYFYRENQIELDRANKSLGIHNKSGSRLGTDDEATNWLSGDMFAILFYSRATTLTSTEIVGLERYLDGKFM